LRRRRKAEEQEIKKLQIFRKTTYLSQNFPDTNIAEKKKSGGTGNKKITNLPENHIPVAELP